jgi:ethanolamine utilization microcompartment shell protein EutS
MKKRSKKSGRGTPGYYVPGKLFSLRARSKDDIKTEIKIAGKAILIGILGGLPIAIAVFAASVATDFITFGVGFSSPSQAAIFNTGLNAGIGFLLIIGTIVLTPLAWRRFSNPRTLTRLAYLAVVIISVGAGMLMPDFFTAWWLSWWLGGLGTTAWWTWSQRWRGSGVAPSPLAGVLRPELHPGQIWFATVSGRKQTKVRPVLVLGSGPRKGTWYCAYFTSHGPRFENLKQYYSYIPAGIIRGIEVDNWISLNDLRTQTRGDFRTYTGIAPTWLYEEVCRAYEITPDAHAHTVDERKAGESPAPTHLAILAALGFRKASEKVNESSQSWKTTWALANLPIESRKDRRERARRQEEAAKGAKKKKR